MANPKRTKASPYLVIRDTREQRGWHFKASEHCLGTTVEKLDTGDYSLDGYQKVLVVERKLSTAEFAINVVQDRFKRALERMAEFQHPFLVCEFTWDDVWSYPKNSGVPRHKWKDLRLSPQFLMRVLTTIPVRYGIHVELVGRLGEQWCSSMFKRVTENVEPEHEPRVPASVGPADCPAA
jgi:hypothetical protein